MEEGRNAAAMRMFSRLTRIVIVLPALAASLAAQSSDRPACDPILKSPTKDSVTLQVFLQAHAFDRSRDIPSWFQGEVAEAVRTYLRVPSPLGIDSYEVEQDTAKHAAHLALRGAYRAKLSRAGRLTEARVTGGARNTAFDLAILDAMHAIDTSGTLKGSAGAALPQDEIEIVAMLRTAALDTSPPATLSDVYVTTGVPRRGQRELPLALPTDSGANVPLFAFRTPLRHVTRTVAQIPGTGSLRYPGNLRSDPVVGQVWISHVVGVDGRGEGGSITAVSANRVEFLGSVLGAFDSFRYHSLEVEGCAVRAVVQAPFTFRAQP